jgi:hypothetical protein
MDALVQCRAAGYTVIATGHSLGGGLTSFVAHMYIQFLRDHLCIPIISQKAVTDPTFHPKRVITNQEKSSTRSLRKRSSVHYME